MKYTRKVLLGVVAVDTGQLMVTDPQYLFGGRVFPEGRGENRAVFWRRDVRQTGKLSRDRFGVEPEVMEDGACRVALPGKTAEEAAEAIKRLAQEQDLLVLSMPWTGSALDRTHEACSGRDRGGQMRFPNGRPGAGVCFESGLGDGVYEVWAYYSEVPGWRERITKVEVCLL